VPETVTRFVILLQQPIWHDVSTAESLRSPSRPHPPIACRHAMLYTEPYGSVYPKPLRCLVRRALGPHPTRRSGAARACGRFDLGARREVSHDPHGHEETCRRPGAGGPRHHGEGRPRADLPARRPRTAGRGSMDREVSPALERPLRRVGQRCGRTKTQGESRWTKEEKVRPRPRRTTRRWNGSPTAKSSSHEP